MRKRKKHKARRPRMALWIAFGLQKDIERMNVLTIFEARTEQEAATHAAESADDQLPGVPLVIGVFKFDDHLAPLMHAWLRANDIPEHEAANMIREFGRQTARLMDDINPFSEN